MFPRSCTKDGNAVLKKVSPNISNKQKYKKCHRAFWYFTLYYFTHRSTNVFICSTIKALRNMFQNYSPLYDVILMQ